MSDSIDDGFPKDGDASGTIQSSWQGITSTQESDADKALPASTEPLQYSGFRPKPFFQALNEILSPKPAPTINQYTTITAPSQDPYEQNADALISRRQKGSTPYLEEFINCHSFGQSAVTTIGSNNGDFFTNTDAGSNTILNVSGTSPSLYPPGSIVSVMGLELPILSVTATSITLASNYNFTQAGQAFTVLSQATSQNTINSNMLRYLNDLFGPDWNYFNAGLGSLLPWVTIPVSLSASFLKIDLLPAQTTVSEWGLYDDKNNAHINDLAGPIGPGGNLSVSKGQGFDYSNNRQIFVQFDSPDAPIIIAKPGRTYYTEGFETVYVTFCTDNGRIRLTAGYGNASIQDNDTSNLNRQNLHLWPGNEVLSDPYLHPVPYCVNPAQYKETNFATGITPVDNLISNVFAAGTWYPFPIIQNKWIDFYEIYNGHLNSVNGVVVGWIHGIDFGYTIGTNQFIEWKICVGDYNDYNQLYARQVIAGGSILFPNNQGSFEKVFSTPIRFVLQGKEKPNMQIPGFPTIFQSYGEDLFLMFRIMGTNNAAIQMIPNVQTYTLGNLIRKPLIKSQNVADFSFGSKILANVAMDPGTLNYEAGDLVSFPSGGFLGHPTFLTTIASFSPLTLANQSPITAIGQEFSVWSATKGVFHGQTLNIHPYPHDRGIDVYGGRGTFGSEKERPNT